MDFPLFSSAISSIESGGNYGILGPLTKGDRAYGKYQVMGANVPSWTKEALGESLTPQQFLANPAAQDAVFQHKFGQYVAKYGPEGAARAWFAGEKGMNNPNAKDVLGTTVSGYGAKFMKNIGQAGVTQPLPATKAPAALANIQNSAQPQQAMPAQWQPPAFAPPPPAQAAPQIAEPQMPMMDTLGLPRRPPDMAMLMAALQRTRPKAPGFSFARG